MIRNKDNNEKPSYSPIVIFSHLQWKNFIILFFPPQPLCSVHSNSNNSNSTICTHRCNNNNNNNNNAPSPCFFLSSPWEAMRRRPRTTFLLSFLFILLFATFSLHRSRHAISNWRPDLAFPDLNTNHFILRNITSGKNLIVDEFIRPTRRVSSIKDSLISTVSVLLPDWEILVLANPNTPLSSFSRDYHCLFPNNVKSLAKFSGVLPFTNRTAFKCDLPESVRRRRLFSQPMLVGGTSEIEFPSPAPKLMKWNFLVYESFSTENDVVLFAKGVNHRQGYGRSPKELRCVFRTGDGIHKAVTAVTSSVQEVFRCPHPNPNRNPSGPLDLNYERVSLEIIAENIAVPSVAHYSPRPRPNDIAVREEFASEAQTGPKHSLCACTMVYNVAKFLREWVMYHSKVGVENFILYDNGSDDDLYGEIERLRGEGYNISTVFWIWAKTQEAGFSHSVLYSKWKGLCRWIMYVDVDEFAFSPSWRDNKNASLKSLLPLEGVRSKGRRRIGQVSMRCLEFGASGNRVHPVEGVTQGYTCRRRVEQRHKSMVLVDAVDGSLRNVIHHFDVNEREGFVTKQVSAEEGVVNHYKYQAWEEFKNKFRRRVSAYVVDWKQALNPHSKDRTPGLGFEAREPKDWSQRFCEVRDERLKLLTRSWFGSLTPNGYTIMPWQRKELS